MCQASSILGLGHTGRPGLKKNTSQFKYSHSLLPPPHPDRAWDGLKPIFTESVKNQTIKYCGCNQDLVAVLYLSAAQKLAISFSKLEERAKICWEDDEMEFGILQFGVNVWRDQLGLMFASYFGFFVWISRAMCGLNNTRQQHLHTCHRSIQQYNTGANSQPCQENRDLITAWELWESSHNAVARLFQWFYLSVIHLILVAPGWISV